MYRECSIRFILCRDPHARASDRTPIKDRADTSHIMQKVIMNDGAGGELMQEFISKHITSHFPKMNSEIPLDALDDSAVVDDIVFTIDGHTVNPLFFPGGDIGRIAISGTVNDISVMGAKPLGIGSSVVLEEGLDAEIVDKVMESMGQTSKECGVPVVTGDTKVNDYYDSATDKYDLKGQRLSGILAVDNDTMKKIQNLVDRFKK